MLTQVVLRYGVRRVIVKGVSGLHKIALASSELNMDNLYGPGMRWNIWEVPQYLGGYVSWSTHQLQMLTKQADLGPNRHFSTQRYSSHCK